MNDAEWDGLLTKALAFPAEPEDKLNERLINQLTARRRVRNKRAKRLSAAILAAVLLLALSVSAYAAVQLFSARQVAKELGDRLLANAFASGDAVQINRSMASGDYIFTLHGLVSGAGLSDFPHSAADLYPDRTYAVVSIARQDGKPMPDTAAPDYGKVPFFISPLVKGLEPWTVNIASMNGSYSEDVVDGVAYRIIECDQVEIFADRGVYLAISSGTSFYSQKAFMYDEQTGEIRARADYPGAAVLFELPLDPAKADHAKAEAYLETLLNPTASQEAESGNRAFDAGNPEFISWIEELRTRLRNGESIGETIVESVKEVEHDESGNMIYTYGDRTATFPFPADYFFEEGQTGFSDRTLSIGGNEDGYEALLLHRDENGRITGRIVILDQPR